MFNLQPWLIALVVFMLTLAGGVVGMAARIPKEHADDTSKEVVKAVIGLVSTMSALVMSLLIATARSHLDQQTTLVQDMAGRVVLLDRTLAQYGPASADARTSLKNETVNTFARLWPEDQTQKPDLTLPTDRRRVEIIIEQVLNLEPETAAQHRLQEQAVQILYSITQTRLTLQAKANHAVQVPLLVVLVLWLVFLFAGFGLFASFNRTGIAAIIGGAVSTGAAIYLLLAMDSPFTGPFRISPDIMRGAIDLLGL